MNKFRLLMLTTIASILLHGCDRILEPVSFYGKLVPNTKTQQEDFVINIRPLTFTSASNANEDPYIRTLMLKGSGSNAKVIKESELLDAKMPALLQKPVYFIGIGDEISLTIQNEFLNKKPKLPVTPYPNEYLIGEGDELTFIQQNELLREESLLKTKGTVGTNGNILLLGIGNISVGNRSISDVRAEVRNILIREGLAPNFQIEISQYNSKKAYLTSSSIENKIITINNLPKTLKEIVVGAGISKAMKNNAVITFTSSSQEYRITAKQLLNQNNSKIYIKENDIIHIETIPNETITYRSTVDSKGYILMPKIGKLKAEGKTISDIQEKAANTLSNDGFVPKFQLELTGFKSKVVYLSINNNTKVIPITSKNISIRELLLNNNLTVSNNGLNLVILKRNGKEYRENIEQILNPTNKDIFIQNADQIEVKNLQYRPGQVFALSGTSGAKIVAIEPSIRETLADVLFVQNGALNNILAKRSEIYLLRGRKPSKAYHLDAQNVSRLLVAAKTELRPNDIIFVAERPIISFTRALSEVAPLRILLRDIENGNIP
jgi:protein involved in polysaccharide export with SLBB domain